MCKVLKASKSGFYDWIKSKRGLTTPGETYLLIRIKEAYELGKRAYGSIRITRQLKKWGVPCYKNQVARIMRKYGIKSITKRRFKVTTDSKHNLGAAPNLLKREFTVNEINKFWVGDITYIWTLEGWLYLSTVIDLYSRKVVGWSAGKRMKKQLVIDSFKAAVAQRKPDKELIFHSDQGRQYASKEFRSTLKRSNALQSMSRKGDCWDNAVAESFFKTIKTELIYWERYRSRHEAELSIFAYIEMFYNTVRLHSANDYMSPCEFEGVNLS